MIDVDEMELLTSGINIQNISSINIDDIDNINKSGSLEGITFYQTTNNKYNVSGFDINIDDNKTIGSVLITKNIFDNNSETCETYDVNNINEIIICHNCENKYDTTFLSRYFSLENNIIIKISHKHLFGEIAIVSLLHILLWKYCAFYEIFTIDSIISYIIFYRKWLELSNTYECVFKNQSFVIDRYFYYALLIMNSYICNYILWFKYNELIQYATVVLTCPSVNHHISKMDIYMQLKQDVFKHHNMIIRKIVCKQLSRVLNLIIENTLNIQVKLTYVELIPYYDKVSWSILNKFIVAFVLACIFNHIDKGSMKIPIMVYKNLYMKDYKYNIVNDREYICKIIADKKWEKLMDIYTLNRLIRLTLNYDANDSYFSDKMDYFLESILFKFTRIMMCWTIANSTNTFIGILSFLFFICKEAPLHHLFTTLIYSLISLFCSEKLLLIILCELSYPIIASKLLIEILYDCLKYLQKCILVICSHTRFESVMLSIVLTFMSFYNHNNIGFLILIMLDLVTFIKLIYLKKSNKKSKKTNMRKIKLIKKIKYVSTDPIENGDINHTCCSHTFISSTDILNFIGSRLLFTIKNNLFIEILDLSIDLDTIILYKMILILSSTLVFGLLSGYDVPHIIFLPIIIQNVVDFAFFGKNYTQSNKKYH